MPIIYFTFGWKMISDIHINKPFSFFFSLAAYSLQQLGLLNATDMIGGYKAWKAAGLSIDLDSRVEKLDIENFV